MRHSGSACRTGNPDRVGVAGLTSQFDVGATDLGIPATCPDARTLYLVGDTWTDTVGGTNWRSPIALWSNTNLPAGVTYSGAVGGATAGSTATATAACSNC